jgi:tetratricopeptide (TPR) repeat protein
LTAKLSVSALIEPMPPIEFEIVKREALTLPFETTDAYPQIAARWAIGWDELGRGRVNEARNFARETVQVGQSLNDPRSTGCGLLLLSMIAMVSGSIAEALEYSEQSLSVAITPYERTFGSAGKGMALLALGRIEEGATLLEEACHRSDVNGFVYASNGLEHLLSFCKILQGRIAEGIHVLEKLILKVENEGYKTAAELLRLDLAEVYLQIVAGGDNRGPLSLPTLRRNFPILLKVMFVAGTRIPALIAHVLDYPHFDPAGFHVGRAKMILGLLYKTKKKRVLALQHLTEAKRILSQFGQTPILARVDAALGELKQ